MASLKVVSDRCDDNSLKLAVVIPPRRNGEPNFGALERALRDLYVITPDAFDPHEPAPPTAPAPDSIRVEAMLERAAEEPDGLKAGEAYREHGA